MRGEQALGGCLLTLLTLVLIAFVFGLRVGWSELHVPGV